MVSDIATTMSFIVLVILKVVDLVTLTCLPNDNPHPQLSL